LLKKRFSYHRFHRWLFDLNPFRIISYCKVELNFVLAEQYFCSSEGAKKITIPME
ncbi:MAG: hypothetical protein ACI8VT_004332, partial [Saprospiraceae bacterium]